jgi:hypothetical protein
MIISANGLMRQAIGASINFGKFNNKKAGQVSLSGF